LNSNDAVVGATTATPSFSIASPSPTVAATPTSSGQAQLTPDAIDDEMTVVIVDDNNNVPVGAGEFIVGGKVKVECNWCKKLLVGSQTTCRIILNLVQLAGLEKGLPHHLFLLKNNSENSRSMSHHLSLLTNNSKNLRSMLHHLMPCHISPLILKKIKKTTSSHVIFLH
jgi:hypothetical protein